MESFSDEQIIAGFAYLPGWQFPFTMVTTVNPQLATELDARKYGTDRLDKLPKEIQIEILLHCDLQALSRLMRTSFKWLDIVQCLQAYQEVLEHCRFLLSVIHRLGNIAKFSLSHLQTLLRSRRCESCGNFGAYVYPVTCQRCCWTCSKLNPVFWVMTRNSVQVCFDLSVADAESLRPVFSTGAAEDEILVQVTDARRLSENIHSNSLRRLAHGVGSRAGDPFQVQSHRSIVSYYSQALMANLNMGDHDPRLVDTKGLCIFEGRQLTIVSQLPVLDGERLDHGCWCRGCAYLAWLADEDPRVVIASCVLTADQSEDVDLVEWAIRNGSRE